jgi:hypothetical protein
MHAYANSITAQVRLYKNNKTVIKTKDQAQFWFVSGFLRGGSVVVKELSYKPEGRWLRPDQMNEFFNLPNPSGSTRPWVLLGLYQKSIPEKNVSVE